MAKTELRQQSIDDAGLDTVAPASVSQFGGVDVIAAIGNHQRERRKSIEDLDPIPRPGKALQ